MTLCGTTQTFCARMQERFRRTLNRGGMSITVTSLTNVAAFLFGSQTSIPAIQWCVAHVLISQI